MTLKEKKKQKTCQTENHKGILKVSWNWEFRLYLGYCLLLLMFVRMHFLTVTGLMQVGYCAFGWRCQELFYLHCIFHENY